MSPKQRRGVETVERLLDTALAVYAEAGETGVTVQALTKSSGVSPGSLYHHFGSVDGLMSALLLRWLGRLLDDVSTALTRSRTARTGIRAAVRAYLAFVGEHPDAARLVHSSFADRLTMAQARQLRDSQEARLSPLAAWLERQIASGELADLPTPLIESMVLGPVVGAARRWLSVGDVDLAQAVRILPDRIWRSVEP